MTDQEVWYRYVDTHGENGVYIHLQEWRVIKHTSRGVMLDVAGPVFVLNDARKRFAYPTKELARASFIRRKEVQCSMLTARLKSAKEALKLSVTIDTTKAQTYASELFSFS